MHQRAHLPKAKVSCLCSIAVFDLSKMVEATIMSNPDGLVDHFKHCNTVDVGLRSFATVWRCPSDFRFSP
jgi:hypothetical protein